MKRSALFALILTASTGLVWALEMSKGKGMSKPRQKEVSIKGKVVDVSCCLY